MSKKNIVFLGLIILFTGIGIFVGTLVNDKKECSCNETKKITEDEYYLNMAQRMYDYFLIAFKNMGSSDVGRDQTIRLSLSSLERLGFPMEDFVTYEGDQECDKVMSYALRKLINDKYRVEVYYKCGSYANYDFTKVETTKINTTTKSISKSNNVNE